MQFDPPLTPARLIRRYKRFLADVEMTDGSMETVHCPNPGAMTGLQDPGAEVWLSRSDNPKRKLPLGLELVQADGALVGINAGFANRIVSEALAEGRVPELAEWDQVRAEVRYGQKSRVDFLLSDSRGGQPDCYVEVKNVHLMRQPGLAEFPDSVTSRGARHLAELADMVRAGHRAFLFYLVQRTDCEAFRVAADIDPDYAAAFREAQAAGVGTFCYDCSITRDGIVLKRSLPVLPAAGSGEGASG